MMPQPAVTMPENASVTDVCKALANARSDSALLTGTSGGGGMTGIVTAIDLTRYAWVGGHQSSPSGVFFLFFVLFPYSKIQAFWFSDIYIFSFCSLVGKYVGF